MKRQRIDSEVERRFVLALIVSKEFLAGAKNSFDPDLIEAPHLATIAAWCLEYFDTYGKPPRRAIEPIYFSWLEKQERPGPDAEAIRELLEDLSTRYESESDINSGYLLDELGVYLSARKLAQLRDDLDERLHRGDVDGALQDLQGFRVPSTSRSAGVDPLNEKDPWRKAFEQRAESLVVFPGDAGKFLNPAFTRESLIGIQGPEKRGKTFWCLEFVIRALQQRRRVAFFEVGDLSETQVLSRLGVRLTGTPLWPSQCGAIRFPRQIESPETYGGSPGVEWVTKECPNSLSERGCEKAVPRFLRRCGIPKGTPYLMMSNHPTSSINVRGIEAILDGWETERGFIPDVIVIDYADILAVESTKPEMREAVNETWAALRRLSQERRCLVIAPTQSDAASYGKRTQTMDNFSNDKRKLAHVTGMLGLNQGEKEKALSVMRLNWIVLRESPHSTRQCLYVGLCLALGRMMTCSRLA